jgi:hypothetical protein
MFCACLLSGLDRTTEPGIRLTVCTPKSKSQDLVVASYQLRASRINAFAGHCCIMPWLALVAPRCAPPSWGRHRPEVLPCLRSELPIRETRLQPLSLLTGAMLPP